MNVNTRPLYKHGKMVFDDVILNVELLIFKAIFTCTFFLNNHNIMYLSRLCSNSISYLKKYLTQQIHKKTHVFRKIYFLTLVLSFNLEMFS